MAPTGVGVGRPAPGPGIWAVGPCSFLTCQLPSHSAKTLALLTHSRCKTQLTVLVKSPAVFVPYTLPPSTDIHPIAICIARSSTAIKSRESACKRQQQSCSLKHFPGVDDGRSASPRGLLCPGPPPIMSATNGHPGLSFTGMNNGLRQRGQGFPPPASKPVLPQHATSYQHYAQPQPQGNSYSQIFPPSSQSPVHNGGARSQQPQAQLPVPASRSRSSNHRQMPPQPSNSPLSYLPTTMGQQTMSQQAMNSQSMNQQSMTTQPMSTQSMTQQAISQQAISHSQSMAQENSMMSQTTTSHPHPVMTPQPPTHSQLQQPPPQSQQSQPVQSEHSVESQDNTPDDAIEVDSSNESMDGEDSALDGRNGDNGTPFVPRTPMGPMMSAPPQGGSYPTLDAVHKAVLDYCTSVGYAIVIGRSKKTVPGLKKVLFVCDRAGKPPKRVSPEMRKRKTSSRKCNCPFGFFAIEQRTQWTVRYRPDSQHLTHNHGPSESPSKHPAARKLDSKMVAAVKSLKESGEFSACKNSCLTGLTSLRCWC